MGVEERDIRAGPGPRTDCPPDTGSSSASPREAEPRAAWAARRELCAGADAGPRAWRSLLSAVSWRPLKSLLQDSASDSVKRDKVPSRCRPCGRGEVLPWPSEPPLDPLLPKGSLATAGSAQPWKSWARPAVSGAVSGTHAAPGLLLVCWGPGAAEPRPESCCPGCGAGACLPCSSSPSLVLTDALSPGHEKLPFFLACFFFVFFFKSSLCCLSRSDLRASQSRVLFYQDARLPLPLQHLPGLTAGEGSLSGSSTFLRDGTHVCGLAEPPSPAPQPAWGLLVRVLVLVCPPVPQFPEGRGWAVLLPYPWQGPWTPPSPKGHCRPPWWVQMQPLARRGRVLRDCQHRR